MDPRPLTSQKPYNQPDYLKPWVGQDCDENAGEIRAGGSLEERDSELLYEWVY